MYVWFSLYIRFVQFYGSNTILMSLGRKPDLLDFLQNNNRSKRKRWENMCVYTYHLKSEQRGSQQNLSKGFNISCNISQYTQYHEYNAIKNANDFKRITSSGSPLFYFTSVGQPKQCKYL